MKMVMEASIKEEQERTEKVKVVEKEEKEVITMVQ